MSLVRSSRDRRLQAAEYAVPALPIDLCFRTYRSPADISPEHLRRTTRKTTTETDKQQGGTLPAGAYQTKPPFIVALATGKWPSTRSPRSPADTTSGEKWRLKNEGSPQTSVLGLRPLRGQQPCRTYTRNLLDTDAALQQPQQHQMAAYGKPAELFGLPGARVSVCVSRQCSIISVCAPPQSVLAGSVLELSKPLKVQVKFVNACVRLSNNQLETLENLVPSLNRVMKSPIINLRWLDLAHNYITSIDPALQELVNLSVLYLHNNLIADFRHLQHLQQIQKLKILTLVGNPVEKANYRVYRPRVLALVPQLRVLDHTAVSNDDRAAAQIYQHRQAKYRRPRAVLEP